jgi:tetratricopeptide (TPR) repeat protein
LQLADEIGDREHSFFAHFYAFGALMVRGETHRAETELQRMREVAEELGQPSQIWVCFIAESMRELFAGRLQRAEELMSRAAELGSGAQGQDATYFYVINLQSWALRREQGRLAEIEASLEGYVAEYPTAFLFRCVLTSIQAETGRAQRARDELNALAIDDLAGIDLEPEWFLGANLLAEVCGTLGDAERAELLYAFLLPYGDCNVFAMPEVSLGSASRPLGLLAATMSRWEEAERHFEWALEMNRRMGTRPWVAHTQHDYARMLIRRGNPGDRARKLLREARDAYETLGMTAWRETAAGDLARLS